MDDSDEARSTDQSNESDSGSETEEEREVRVQFRSKKKKDERTVFIVFKSLHNPMLGMPAFSSILNVY